MERQPAIDRQPVLVLRVLLVLLVLRVPVRVLRVRVAQLLVPVPVRVLPLEAQWLALLPLVAQPPVRPDLGSNPP